MIGTGTDWTLYPTRNSQAQNKIFEIDEAFKPESFETLT